MTHPEDEADRRLLAAIMSRPAPQHGAVPKRRKQRRCADRPDTPCRVRQVLTPFAHDKPPTQRQRQILIFIAERELLGLGTTVDDIGRRFGIRSPNGVIRHLDALIGRGLIEARARTARGIRLVGCAYERVYADGDAGRRLREALEGAPS